MTLEESRKACRELTRRTAKNFGVTFLVLPKDQRRDMNTLYAFMRHTDDLSDRDVAASERRADLEQWRLELDAVLAGQATSSEYLPAVAEMIQRRGIDPQYLHAVIDGCISDTEPVAIETRDDLERYCYQVAGVVGLCCIGVWGYRGHGIDGTDEQRRRAEQLAVRTGFAFQLTNILRDVREDALAGRRYLPAEDLRDSGCDLELLSQHPAEPPTGAVRELIRFEVARAREAYEESSGLVELLSPPGRRILTAMRSLYGEILNQIERRDFDVFSQRIRVPASRKLLALLQGWSAR